MSARTSRGCGLPRWKARNPRSAAVFWVRKRLMVYPAWRADRPPRSSILHGSLCMNEWPRATESHAVYDPPAGRAPREWDKGPKMSCGRSGASISGLTKGDLRKAVYRYPHSYTRSREYLPDVRLPDVTCASNRFLIRSGRAGIMER